MMPNLPKREENPGNHDPSNRTWRIVYVEANTDGTIGGSHTSLLNLIRGLDKSKYIPVVVFFAHHQLIPEFLAAGAEVHVLSVPPAFSFGPSGQGISRTVISRALNLPLMVLRKALNMLITILIFGILRSAWFLWRERIDILHLNNSVPIKDDWLIAGKLLGKKCVGHQRGIIPTSPRSGLIRRLRRAAKMLDAAISVSNAVKEDMAAKGAAFKENIVIHDALPEEYLTVGNSSEGDIADATLPSTPKIGIIGNIKPWKGQRVVIEALPELVQNHPEVKCLIVGEASSDSLDYFEQLNSLIPRLGVQGNVVFTGYRKNIRDIMNSLDIVVHASITPEPFGMVVIEAMALGKPVIATNFGGPKEIIEHGVNGVLVTPDDPCELARVIDHLFKNWSEAVRMGKRAREHVKQHFSVEENVSKTEAVYETLIGSAH
jgi:glycosyltransferase involved in cell wall biosynthesis